MHGWKLCAPMIALALLLTGCGGETTQEDPARSIREEYAALTGGTGQAVILADYGQRIYEYTVDFSVTAGETVLTITAPEELAGITARIAGGESRLEYDGVTVETGPLTSEGLSPIGALPTLLNYAKTGFSDSAGEENGLIRVDFRDPELEPGRGLQASLWFRGEDHLLLRGELSEDGRQVIQCELTQFSPTFGGEE